MFSLNTRYPFQWVGFADHLGNELERVMYLCVEPTKSQLCWLVLCHLDTDRVF